MEPKVISNVSNIYPFQINSIPLQLQATTLEQNPAQEALSPEQKIQSPALRLMDLLIAREIVDKCGHINYNIGVNADYCEQINKRMDAFLNQPNQIKVRGLKIDKVELEIELSLREIIDHLSAIEPAISIELVKKNALFFLGFEAIEKIFLGWEIDLVQVCGTKYVDELKKEIEQKPCYSFIQYFVDQPDFNKIATLKRAVLDLIATKLPINENDPAYPEMRQKILHELFKKKDRHYKEWVNECENFDLFVKNIVADELVVKEQVEPKNSSPAPVGALSIEFKDGQIIELEISQTIPSSKLRFGVDGIHLPILKSEFGFFRHFEHLLIQGIVDKVCRHNTFLPFTYVSIEDWIDLIIGAVQGETSRSPALQTKIMPKVIEIALSRLAFSPEKTLGIILEELFSKALNKMVSENRGARKNIPYAALALSLAACETLLGYISPNDLMEFIHLASIHWKKLTQFPDDGTLFYLIARILKEGIPYEVLSAHLQLSAYNLLYNGTSTEQISCWINQRGWEIKSKKTGLLEDIIQLRVSDERQNSFYLQIPHVPSRTMQTLLNNSFVCQKEVSLLQALQIRILGIAFPTNEITYENVWIPHLEKLLAGLLALFIDLVKTAPDHHVQMMFLSHFHAMINAKNHLISKKENDQIAKLIHKLSSNKKCTQEIIIKAFLNFLESSDNPHLNQAYLFFIKQSDPKYRKPIARSLRNEPISTETISPEIPQKNVKEIDLPNPSRINSKIDAAKEAIQILKAKTLSVFIEYLHSNEIQKHFEDSPMELWQMILLPALGEISEMPLTHSHPLYSFCLNRLTDRAEEIVEFLSHLKKSASNLNQTFPKQLKRELLEHQAALFRMLSQSQNEDLILDFAHFMLTHQIPLQQEIGEIVLSAAKNILENPDSITLNKIHELLCDSVQKKIWKEVSTKLLSQIFHRLSLLYVSTNFLLGFQYLKKWIALNPAIDPSLSLEYLKTCANQNKIEEFAFLTQKISLTKDLALIRCWQEKFNSFFCMPREGEYQEKQLKSLDLILQAPEIFEFFKETECLSAVLTKLFKSPFISPFFEKNLECAFHILPFVFADRQIFFLKVYESLKISSNDKIKIKAWDILKSEKDLLPEIKKRCWMHLLQGMQNVNSDLTFQMVNTPDAFPILDVESSEHLEAYELLFNQIAQMEIENAGPEFFKRITLLYSKLQNSHSSTLNIPLSYIKILLKSGNPNDRKEAERLFLRILSKHCFRKTPVEKSEKIKEEYSEHTVISVGSIASSPIIPWDASLVKTSKSILKNISLEKRELYGCLNTLINYPNHEVGCLFIEKLYSGKLTDKDLFHIGLLIYRLIETSEQLPMKEYTKFKYFCRSKSFNLSQFFDELTTFSNGSLSLVVLDCLLLNETKNLFKKDEKFDLIYNAAYSSLSFFEKYGEFEKKLLENLFILLPELKIQKSKEEIDRLADLVFRYLYNGFAHSGDFDEFVDNCNLVNEIFKMCMENEPSANKKNTGVILNEYFFIFAKVCIESMSKFPLSNLNLVLVFITDILLKSLKDPHADINRLAIHLLNYSFMCLFIVRKGSINPKFKYFDKLKLFPNEVDKFFNNHHSKDKLFLSIKKSFTYYFNSQSFVPKIYKEMRVHCKIKNHELINIISSLINEDHSEIIILLSCELIEIYIKDLLPSYHGIVILLKEMIQYIRKLDSLLQPKLFLQIGSILLYINKIIVFEKGYENKSNVIENCVLEIFASIKEVFNKKELNFLKFTNFINNYPRLVAINSSFLLKSKSYSIYFDSLVGYIFICNKVLKNWKLFDWQFKEIVMAPLRAMFEFPPESNISEDVYEKRAGLINQWLKRVLKYGKNIDEEEKVKGLMKDLLKEALEKGIYKNFSTSKDRYREALVLSR